MTMMIGPCAPQLAVEQGGCFTIVCSCRKRRLNFLIVVIVDREKVRRSTIRNLFDALRRSVPAVEKHDGLSDRQILIEAAKHIEELNEQELVLEEGVLELKIENCKLRLAQARAHANRPIALTGLAAIADATLVDTLTMELEEATTRLEELRARPRPQPPAASNEEGDSALAGADQSDLHPQDEVHEHARSRSASPESGTSGNSSQHPNQLAMFQMTLDSPESKKEVQSRTSLSLEAPRESFHRFSMLFATISFPLSRFGFWISLGRCQPSSATPSTARLRSLACVACCMLSNHNT